MDAASSRRYYQGVTDPITSPMTDPALESNVEPIKVGKVAKPFSARFSGLQALLGFDNWPMLVLGRLFDRKTGMVIYRKNGLEILVDHHGGDENGTRQCIVSDMYSKYLPGFNLRGSVSVLDLGANGGGFPLMLKVQGVAVGRAACVELNPMTYLRLGLNLASNFGSSAVAINAGVCSWPEGSEIQLASVRGSTMTSISEDRPDSAIPLVSVSTTTLDSLYKRYFNDGFIDICKIDIEGAEYEILESTPDDVFQKIRYILVELHDPVRTPAYLKRIGALGFTEVTVPEDRRTDDKYVAAFRGPAA
jgi:FkbM family methyltransferase